MFFSSPPLFKVPAEGEPEFLDETYLTEAGGGGATVG